MKNYNEYNKRIRRMQNTYNKFNKAIDIEKYKISAYEMDYISDINVEAKCRAKKRFNNMKNYQCECCCNIRKSKIVRKKYKRTFAEIKNDIKYNEEINEFYEIN